MKVLFINHQKSQCGIYEFGRNISDALKNSKYQFLYFECASSDEVRNLVATEKPNCIIYNYSPGTMRWVNKLLTQKIDCFQVGIIHEVDQKAADLADDSLFDFHIAHDPTLELNNPLVFKVGRLIPDYQNRFSKPAITTIGTFGFAGKNKGFKEIVELVQQQFDEAIIKINMPVASFGDINKEVFNQNIIDCKNALTKNTIKLEITHDFLDERGILDFLAQNSINLFLYQDMVETRGLSAAVELAIAAKRPVGITNQKMFRHIVSANPSICIEDLSINEIIENDLKPLQPFYESWTAEKICRDYEKIVEQVVSSPAKKRRRVGLFVNCIESQGNIHNLGKMVFNCAEKSNKYSLDYTEIYSENLSVSKNYDFYFFNYHPTAMIWLDTDKIRETLKRPIFTIVLETSPNKPFIPFNPKHFDGFCVIDPTLKIYDKKFFTFPRPLGSFTDALPIPQPDIPMIGSFGFATSGKCFEKVVEAVNKEFERAIVRINIPFVSYFDESGKIARELSQNCREIAKDGIEVRITHDLLSRENLIKWCGQNTLNCFFSDNDQQRLSANPDFAIMSGQPLITSDSPTFRHITEYIEPYPNQSLKEAIEKTKPIVEKIQNNWSPENFERAFEEMLDCYEIKITCAESEAKIELKKNINHGIIQDIRDKLAIRTRIKNLKNKITNSFSKREARKIWYDQKSEIDADDISFDASVKFVPIENRQNLNLILDNNARTLYAPVIKQLGEILPKTLSRKIPEANVQQAFTLNTVYNLAKNIEHPKILCVGSYESSDAMFLKKIGFEIEEIDPCINYSLEEFFELHDTKKASYDIVFSTSVIEHVENDERFIKQIAELLKEGGIGVLTCDFKEGFVPGDSKPAVDFRFYNQNDFTERFLPILADCELIGNSNWDCPNPDFYYPEGNQVFNYTFATFVFRKIK